MVHGQSLTLPTSGGTGGDEVRRKSPKHEQDPEATRIAEKVKFWSEQDRINQALIPRVIRQGELLTKHIAEHDDLPRLLNQVVSDALAKQSRAFEVALDERLEHHEKKLRNRLLIFAGIVCAIALAVAALA